MFSEDIGSQAFTWVLEFLENQGKVKYELFPDLDSQQELSFPQKSWKCQGIRRKPLLLSLCHQFRVNRKLLGKSTLCVDEP